MLLSFAHNFWLITATMKLTGNALSRRNRRCRILLEKPCEDSSADTQNPEPGSRGSEARDVPGRMLLGPKPGRVNRGRIADGVDESDGNGSFCCWLRNDVGDPGFDERRAAVDCTEGEDCEDILGHAVLDGGYADEEDTAEAGETADELPLGLVSVGKPTTSDDIDKGSHVSGNCVVCESVSQGNATDDKGISRVN